MRTTHPYFHPLGTQGRAAVFRTLILVGLLVLPLLGQIHHGQAHHSVSVQVKPENEIEDLILSDIPPDFSPTEVLRSRPFVLDWNRSPAFSSVPTRGTPYSEAEALAQLEKILNLREVTTADRDAALTQFHAPSIRQMIPSPALRSALLMLSAWEPYGAVVKSVLDGANDTGKPFDSIDFADLSYAGAVATIFLVGAPGSGRYRIEVSQEFENSSPVQLAPVVFHESLHGNGSNSTIEEVTAMILDTIIYAELLLIDPSAAFEGTDLALFNNAQILALLNSCGSRGAGYLGIATSPSGDIFVGLGLEDVDSDSIRSEISEDDFYSTLSEEGAPLSQATSKIVRYFADPITSGDQIPETYDRYLLALIDNIVGGIISPGDAVKLATLFDLQITTGVNETGNDGAPVLSPPGISGIVMPSTTTHFDLNQVHRTISARSSDQVLDDLHNLIESSEIDAEAARMAVARYESPTHLSLSNDPELLAALALLDLHPTWEMVAQRIRGERPYPTSLTLEFAPLAIAAPASFHFESQTILINEMLHGENLVTLAAAIVEGALLEGDQKTANLATSAAVLSTIAYGELLLIFPGVYQHQTWGTIWRNLDLLALLNSSSSSFGSQTENQRSPGFLSSPGQADDVLPGIIRDAESFDDFVAKSQRFADLDSGQYPTAAPLLISILHLGGVSVDRGAQGLVVSDQTIVTLDKRLSAFLDQDETTALILAMNLLRVS